MKDSKNYSLGGAIAYALACLPWVFQESLKKGFDKPVTLLLAFIIISPLVAAFAGWGINMTQKKLTGEIPNGGDVKRTVQGAAVGAIAAALIGFGWYLPIGSLLMLGAAIYIHFKK